MTTGNIENKIVGEEFWPHCDNCDHYDLCAIEPRHDAFPHSWHWGHMRFGIDGRWLVTKSWVGTMEIGADHTGCKEYSINEIYTHPLDDKHKLFIELNDHRKEIDEKLNIYAVNGINNKQIMEMQDELDRVEGEMLAIMKGVHNDI